MKTQHNSKSLLDITIMLTRARDQAEQMVELLEEQGARIIMCPAIEIGSPADLTELKQAINDRALYDWLVFTSVNGVRFFTECVRLMQLDPALFQVDGRPHCAAIGPATAARAEKAGFIIELVPDEFVAEALVKAIISINRTIAGKRFLLPRADRARPLLLEQLRENGAIVHEIVTYNTILASGMPGACKRELLAHKVDLVTFTSSSTVEGFFSLLRSEGIELSSDRPRMASIGPITTRTLREYGVEPTIEAREYTIPGLVEAIRAYYRDH